MYLTIDNDSDSFADSWRDTIRSNAEIGSSVVTCRVKYVQRWTLLRENWNRELI